MKEIVDQTLASNVKRRTFIKWGAASGAAVVAGNALPLIAYSDSPEKTGKVTGASVACAADAAFVYSGGGKDWTVTMVSGVAGDPVSSDTGSGG